MDYEEIDPDGDTLIIYYLTITSQSENELVLTERPSTEEPMAVDDEVKVEEIAIVEEPAIGGPVIASEADHDGNKPLSELRIRVSKKHLTVASRRARRMFQGDYLEAQRSEDDRFYHWKIEPLFDPESLKIVLRIIHAQTQYLPNSVTLEMMVSIAEIVDDLGCYGSVSFFANMWTSQLFRTLPSQISDELMQWIFIASVFRLDDVYRQATKVAIMQSTKRLDSLGLPIFPGIIDNIEQKRQDLLEDFIGQLLLVLETLCSTCSCHFPRCALIMLGALTKQMHNMKLHSPCPLRPFPDLSLSSVLAAVRNFASPSPHLPTANFSHYSYDPFGSIKDSDEDVWLLQKDVRSSYREKKLKHRRTFEPESEEPADTVPGRLKVHSCHLQDFLEPEVQLIESRVSTMDLNTT